MPEPIASGHFVFASDGGMVSTATASAINAWREGDIPSMTAKPRKRKSPRIITSSRRFGVEIECLVDEDPRLVGASLGRDSSIHQTRASRDLSGREVRTEILQGISGQRTIKQICTELKRVGAKINHTCGLHIHLDSGNIKYDFRRTKNLLLFYVLFDEVIMAMLPKYRRNNRFARPLRYALPIGRLVEARNYDELGHIWYHDNNKNRHDTRYFGINFRSFFDGQTLEIRYHSPTLNYRKIVYWVAFHQAIMDQVPKLDDGKVWGTTKDALFFEEKLDAFFSLVALPSKLKTYMLARIAKFNPTFRSITK